MVRSVLAAVTIGAFVLLTMGPASAFQCPSLVKKITDEAGQRFDDAAYDANKKATEADELHKAGKHAEAEAKAKEGLKMLGMQ